MRAHVRPFTLEDAYAVGGWRYAGPHAVYDGDAHALIEELDCYRAVSGTDELIGFFCTGSAARIPGLPAVDGVIDLGLGMHPSRVGRGDGVHFGTLVLEHVAAEYGSGPVRVAIQSWNHRSLGLARRLGFHDAGTHEASDVDYQVLIRPAR